MWDLIVSVPDHCLSFYFVVPSDVPPFWCCYASGPIWVHERSDIDARAVRYGFETTNNNGPGN